MICLLLNIKYTHIELDKILGLKACNVLNDSVNKFRQQKRELKADFIDQF